MYSVVIPVYNEAGNLTELHRRLLAVMAGLNGSFELIFVNDGSTDSSAKILAELKPATIVTFRKNFGQTAALDAGFKHAQGDLIITLDGDLQNPPEEIPKLIAYLESHNLDVVSGWRKDRRDSMMKRFVSRGAYGLRSFFINDGIHDSGCTLKVYRKACIQELDLFGEIHRFIPGLLKWQGFNVGEMVVAHASRTNGQSKYGSNRILKGFVDMIGLWFWRKYSSRPLHLFGGTGVLLTMLGGVMLIVLAVARLAWDYPLSTSIWPLMAILFILVGLQLFITGLIAEILIKNYYRERRPYSIANVQRH